MLSSKIRAVSALLSLTFLLSGCTLTERLDSTDSAGKTTAATKNADGQPYFGMAYNSSESVNPITSTSKINRLLIDAMYEGLFVLDNTFTPQPLLCRSYTGDGTNFTFQLKSGVTFWSGQPLRASDVVYCYDLARRTQTSPYYDRMQQVASVTAPNDTTVQITLKEPNTQFARLLDIPVFRQGTESNAFADGTGPYQLQTSGTARWLAANTKWHMGSVSLYQRIDLIATTSADAIVYSFETGDVSLTRAERISATPATIKGAVEVYQMPTANLQYLGVNFAHAPYQNPTVRQAISAVIDRESICTAQLQSFANPAVLPVNPQPAKSSTLSYETKADTESALAILTKAGIKDSDGDGVQDYSDLSGKRIPLAPVILVNSENTFKVSAAQQVASYLASIGIPATVRAVSFADYQKAITDGNYDLYYAETQMTPDFDLRPLISTTGALNYGACGNPVTDADLQQVRAASGNALNSAKQALYVQLMNNMPIIPIAFLRGQIVLRSGLMEGYSCAPYTAFYNIRDWRKP